MGDMVNLLVGALTIGVGVLSIVNGWVLFVIRSNQAAIDALQSTDAGMKDELTAIKVLVAGSYLTRDEFQAAMTAQTTSITRAIDRLEGKLDNKADKAKGAP